MYYIAEKKIYYIYFIYICLAHTIIKPRWDDPSKMSLLM